MRKTEINMGRFIAGKKHILVIGFFQWLQIFSSACLAQSIHRHPAPIVNFFMSEFCYGDTAYFTNTSERASVYTWNIYEQDAVYDTLYNPIYTSADTNIKFLFQHKGKYRIELIGDNGHVISVNRPLTVDNIPIANFSYHDCLSQFSNMSVCYSSCLWNFGDGNTSTQISPVHYYDSVGKFKVSLVVAQGVKSDTLTDSVMVYTLNDLNGEFSYRVNKDSVQFLANDSISGPFTEYYWTFGDGAKYNAVGLQGGRKVYHTYAIKDATYTVFLLAKSFCLLSYSNHNVFVPDSTPVTGTRVYPNPAQSTPLYFVSERKKELTRIIIMNAWGHEENDYTISETVKGYNIGMEGLVPGMYFVHFCFGSEIMRYKIVKE